MTSRAVELRDVLVAELRTTFEIPVLPMVIPDWTVEELQSGPRIGVRHLARLLNRDMGPDINGVIVSASVFGVSAAAEGYDVTRDGYRAAELQLADEYDELTETLISLFTPGGRLSREYLAGFRLDTLTQEQAFDVPHYYENGVWVSSVDLTYIDTIDE